MRNLRFSPWRVPALSARSRGAEDDDGPVEAVPEVVEVHRPVGEKSDTNLGAEKYEESHVDVVEVVGQLALEAVVALA